MPATATLKTRAIQGESLSAATDRLANSVLLREGVVDKAGNSFQVLQNLGTDMNVKIGSGTAFDRAVVEGDNAGQGTFIPEHQNATQVLPISAADPTLDRIDIVILRVYDDTFDSSGNDYADLEVIQGTPNASPVPPATPSTSIVLAEILVQNAVTQIVNGDITDKRTPAKSTGAAPGGELAYAQITALQNVGLTEEDITGLSVSVTLTEKRKLLIETWFRGAANLADAEVVSIRVKEDGVQIADRNIVAAATTAFRQGGGYTVARRELAAATYTFKVTAIQDTGAGNFDFSATTGSPAFILVTDLGPAD